jgi:hypothetical protein
MVTDFLLAFAEHDRVVDAEHKHNNYKGKNDPRQSDVKILH